jgi:hypothetical protein
MDTKFFEQLVGKVDPVSGVIHGVSVITGGVTARGHELEVDNKTLEQLFECACKMGKVPVKWNHRSGADAVAGYLENFRIKDHKLLGDWHLLKSHAQYEQALELAQRMPECIGLSAAFMGEDEKRSDGKTAARCRELISVDVVANPAANPNGFFEANFGMSVDTQTNKQTLMSTPNNQQPQAEPSLKDVLDQLTAINARLDQQDQFNAELQQSTQGQQEPDGDENEITIEDLLTLTPEQISQLVAEGHMTEDDAAGIHALQAEAMAGDDEAEEAETEPSEEAGELAGAGVETSAGGGSELSALRAQVKELSAKFESKQASEDNATIEHHFATIEGTLTELSSQNASLNELNSKLQARCDAQAHALRTGTRPVAFSAEGDISSSNLELSDFEKLVKNFESQGKTKAEAIRLAHKESPDAHAKHLSDRREARSV